MNPRTTSDDKQPKSEENLDYEFPYEGEPYRVHSDSPNYGQGGKKNPASGRARGEEWRHRTAFGNGLANGTLSKKGASLIDILVSFNSSGRTCFAGNEWLAKRLNITPGGAKNLITRMVAQGWIKRYGHGHTRTLEINDRPVQEHYEQTVAPSQKHRAGANIKSDSNPPLQKTSSSSRGSTETASRLSGSPAGGDSSAKQNHPGVRRDDKAKQSPMPRKGGRAAVKEPEPLVPARSHRRDRPAPEVVDVRVTDRHRALADKIKAFVKKQGDTVSSGYRDWSKALVVLEKTLASQGVSFADIEELWDWHERNWMKGGYRWPTVLSARQFAQRFADIRQKRRRMQSGEKLLAPQRELSPAARRVMDGISNLQWPASAEGSIGNAVQQSLDNLKDFFGRMDSLKDPPKELQIARDVLRSKMTGGDEWYVTGWFENLWRSAGAWERGPTDLSKFSWSENNTYFVTQAAKWMESEFGDGSLYRRLLAELDKRPRAEKDGR